MALVNACVEPVLIDNPNTATVPIHFRVLTSDVSLQTKAQVSGYEQAVNRLFMYCFDQNGKYLGRYETVKSNTDNTPGVTPVANQAAYDGSFYGKVPPATARIHFIANVDINVGNDKIGFSEEQVFHGSRCLGVLHVPQAGYQRVAPVRDRDAEGLTDFRLVEHGVVRAGCEVLILLTEYGAHLAAYRLGGGLRAMCKDNVVDLVDGECEVVPRAYAFVGVVVDARVPCVGIDGGEDRLSEVEGVGGRTDLVIDYANLLLRLPQTDHRLH